ncbi:META domain-containing protein [Variovorax sp. ZT4R33]|uniref:META domain-containing protein n=1 Tax=Variovorax sp. ZT4R33 TaxID=3443743 RepID=UPI003F449960
MRPLARVARPAVLLLFAAASLLLAGCGTRVSLDEPIESLTWRLLSVGTQPALRDADPRRDAQLQFDGARVSGSGGCNRISGGYERTGHRLKIGPIAATRMACIEPERSAMETNFLIALQATTGYSRLGTQLMLLDDGGRTLAVLDSR